MVDQVLVPLLIFKRHAFCSNSQAPRLLQRHSPRSPLSSSISASRDTCDTGLLAASKTGPPSLYNHFVALILHPPIALTEATLPRFEAEVLVELKPPTQHPSPDIPLPQ